MTVDAVTKIRKSLQLYRLQRHAMSQAILFCIHSFLNAIPIRNQFAPKCLNVLSAMNAVTIRIDEAAVDRLGI